MLRLYTNDNMARKYLQINNIVGAFVWHDDDGFNVYLGDPASAVGFKESGPMRKREAIALRDQLNARIRNLTA